MYMYNREESCSGLSCWYSPDGDHFKTAPQDVPAPNELVFSTFVVIFGVLFCVSLWYLCKRRPKFEYALMTTFCALEAVYFGYMMRFYFSYGAIWGIHAAANSVALGLFYSLYVRWTWIADKFYGKKTFDRGFGNLAAQIIVPLIMIACIVAAVWGYLWIWIVFMLFVFVLWVIALVDLTKHRKSPSSRQRRTIILSAEDWKYGSSPYVTSHGQLDRMLVLLIVVMTIVLGKNVAEFVGFICLTWYFASPVHFYLSIVPEIAFAVILASPEALAMFEPERHLPGHHVPEMREANPFEP